MCISTCKIILAHCRIVKIFSPSSPGSFAGCSSMRTVPKKKRGHICLSVSYPESIYCYALTLSSNQILFNLSVCPNLYLLHLFKPKFPYLTMYSDSFPSLHIQGRNLTCLERFGELGSQHCEFTVTRKIPSTCLK